MTAGEHAKLDGSEVPNLVIYRVGEHFVEHELDESFNIENKGVSFEVMPNDSFLEMEEDNVVLAMRSDEGSIDLRWYLISGPTGDEFTPAWELPFSELQKIVKQLCEDYMKNK